MASLPCTEEPPPSPLNYGRLFIKQATAYACLFQYFLASAVGLFIHRAETQHCPSSLCEVLLADSLSHNFFILPQDCLDYSMFFYLFNFGGIFVQTLESAVSLHRDTFWDLDWACIDQSEKNRHF